MLEKLSPLSLKCFKAAKQHARRLSSAELDTAHLLLGLMQHRDAWGTGLLKSQVDASRVVKSVEDALGAEKRAPGAKLVVSTQLKDALKRGIALAGGGPVAPIHLLVALLETDARLSQLLDGLDIDTAAVVRRLKESGDSRVLQQRSASEPTAEAQGGGNRAESSAETAPSSQVVPERKQTPTLDRFGRDLTRLAAEGELHPIVGREREMAAVVEILCRTMKRNPILVGAPGVGKTALAEGLAQRIVGDQVPPLLQNKRLVELSVSSLVAGASQVGEFEKRLQRLVGEVRAAGDVILFIDEAHALMGAGGIYGLQDAATILKPALSRGDIVCIGSTTTHEYRKYIEKDGALARRFQPVRVEEPDKEGVLAILKVLSPRFEEHFQVSIDDELLAETYELAKNYLKNRCFPDKAIDLLERAASRAMLQGGERSALQADTLLSVLSDMTGIPLEKLSRAEAERYLRLEESLTRRVIGQHRAVESISGLIRLTKRRLDLDPRRPDGVFLFVGPPGVGKTEMAKALTEFLFSDEERLIRLDMSEFSSEFTVSRLIGSPPGYVGYDQGGQLTERVRSQPFSVLLLDEMEKAHPAVLNLFLQVFDDGRLTDAQGRTVHFSDVTIIMTSNLASDLWFRRRMGFGVGQREEQITEDAVMDVLRRKLPGEFLSRVDQVVIFDPLSDDTVLEIARIKLEEIVRQRFARQGIGVSFDPAVVRYIAGKGYDARLGCRRLERVIQKAILEPLAERMYRSDWCDVQSIQVTVAGEEIAFSRSAVPSVA